MKYKKIIIIFLLFFILFIFSVFFSLINMGNSNIFSNIFINNVNLSDKSKENAISLLKNSLEEKNKSEIKIIYTDNNSETYEKSIDLSILNLTFNIENSISSAYNLGRAGNIFQNNFTILKTLLHPQKLTTNFELDEKMLDNIISDISANLPGKLIQSSYYIDKDTLIITRGSPGITVDKDNFMKAFTSAILDFSNNDICINLPVKYSNPENIDLDKIHNEIYKEAKDAYFEKNPFKVFAEIKGVDFDVNNSKEFIAKHPDNKEYSISLKYTEPKVKLKDIEINVFPNLLGTFSTRYDASKTDRSTNLNLAAKKINGFILAPGEEFSYNKIVGERTIEAGYKEAKIYSGGKIIDGLGGGICQVSSTLYNAVVFANLKVTQRFNHQFTTSYVPAGRDATVSYGSKDFSFINNRKYPIKIMINIDSGVAKVDIYGIKEEQEFEIDFDTEIISNIPYETKYEKDASLDEGKEVVKQKGTNGIIVNTYKIKKQNGITVSKEILSKDTYNTLDRIILKSSI